MTKNVSKVSGESTVKIICPCCGEEVGMEHFSCKSGEKGGKGGRGASKARSSEQARAAVNARWAKERAQKAMLVNGGE